MNERIRHILEEIKPSDCILDVGCVSNKQAATVNDNWLHGAICKKCPNVLGIDIETSGLSRLRRIGYNVRKIDCERMNLGSTFDIIIAGELLEHLSNPGTFLEKVKKHLKPKGKFIISVPNAYCYYNILSIIFRSKVPIHEQHKCWYDTATIKNLLKTHGFLVHKFKFLPIPNTGRGRLVSLILYHLGLRKLSAAGFLLVCQIRSHAPSYSKK